MKSLLSVCTACLLLPSGALAQVWYGYGGNAQHSGIYRGNSQSVGKIHWQTNLDDSPNYYGGEVLIHYPSIMITAANTVVHGYRFTTSVNGQPDYDNWKVIGRTGTSGVQAWQMSTDYSAPMVYPNGWTSVFPLTLAQLGNATGLVSAAKGGSILVRPSADALSSTPNRYVFYTTLQDFYNNQAQYAPIKINTPLTADNAGNVYFGYWVTAEIPPNVSALGTGGVAKVNVTTGQATYRSVESLGIDPSLTQPAMNAAPALGADGNSVYFALTGGTSVLAKLSTQSLSTTASTKLYDPSISGALASLISVSSASPMVGPDGHVFMGVFGNQWRESHGWMLQFDANLSQTGAGGKRYAVGSFGWDDTPSVVPSNIVPSYKGTSSYLILTKYNNYDDNGGDPGADGSNKVGVLDPSSDSTTRDRQSGIPVMNEVLTVLSPNKTNDDPQHPNARFEWCINAAAIDVPKKGAIINCEDGHTYRWSFVTNTLTEALNLEPPTGEAYTSTVIGPDGQVYSVNNAVLFAMGTPVLPYSVSVYIGTSGRGNLQDIYYVDGNTYSCGSVSWSDGQQAAVEADYVFPNPSISSIQISSYAAAAPGAAGFVYAYSYTQKKFVALGSGALGSSQSLVTGSNNTNAAQFFGPGGTVRVLVRGEVPSHISVKPFTFSVDQISCSVD